MKYKTRWRPYRLNKKFWEEVIVGRKVVGLGWSKEALTTLVLDNGEKLYIYPAPMRIVVDSVGRKEKK